MILSNQDLSILCNCAIAAATQAGRVIRNFSGTSITVSQKDGGENLASQVVTEVDILSEKMILSALKSSCEKFDIAILAEESSDSGDRFVKDYFWSIDPLDGTLPFTESRSGYSVSIALVKSSGEPVIGVIYDPLTDTLYHSICGIGAFRNGEPWTPKESKSFHLICDRSFMRQKHYNSIIQKLEVLAKRLELDRVEIISHGGAALNACWVLEHSPACYFKFPKTSEGGGSLWDYAATAAFFNEFGAVATDIYGEMLDLNRKESSFMNHRGVIYASNFEISRAIQNIFKELTM